MESIRQIQAIATKLYIDLHSAAEENLISSLIAAAFNENRLFRKWIMKEIGFNSKLSTESFFAQANDNILPGVRCSKTGAYTLSEVIFWDSREGQKWNELQSKGNRLSADDARSVRAGYLEAKWDSITNQDAIKYAEFLANIKNKGLCEKHKFALLVWLENTKLNYIRKQKRKIDLLEWEQPIKSLADKNVPILTYHDVYDCLKKTANKKTSGPLLLTKFAIAYLELYLNPAHKEVWEYYLSDRQLFDREWVKKTVLKSIWTYLLRYGLIAKMPSSRIAAGGRLYTLDKRTIKMSKIAETDCIEIKLGESTFKLDEGITKQAKKVSEFLTKIEESCKLISGG